MKKPIRIIKSLFLLLLFVSIGCNSNRRNNQGSESQQLLEDESDMEFPNARYAGVYKAYTEEGEFFGRATIYCQAGDSISFELEIGWSSVSGGMRIKNGKGVYKDRYSDCILEFAFADNSVSISEGKGGSDCRFSDNVHVNHTFIREPEEISPPSTSEISEDMLWDIFIAIPEDSVPDYLDFNTMQERRLAKINKQFKIQYKDCDNHLLYDKTNADGIRKFMGIAGYLTEDEKKIIALFYYGGSVDIMETFSKQTYEYDIATGGLKAIESLIDPFTEDEFFDETIITSGQLKKLRTSFHSNDRDRLIGFSTIDRDGFNMFFENQYAFWVRDALDESAYYKYCDVIQTFYEGYIEKGRREWDGKRFVKGKKYPPDFLIIDEAVGRFKIGEQIENPYQHVKYNEYKFEQTERTEMREGTEEKIIEYTFSKSDDARLIIKPSYDDESDTYTDKTGEIIILSEKYKTKDLIGINSTIEDFIKKYPDYRLWWTYVSDMYVLDSKTAGENIQFLLDAEDCIIEPATDSDMTILSPTDFKKDSKIVKIRVH